MKTTPIDIAKGTKRKAAVEAIKKRGRAANEKSMEKIKERIALIEEILGLEG